MIPRYPAASHAFLQREITELIGRGAEIQPVALRRSSPADLLSERDRRDFEMTRALLPTSPFTAIRRHLRALFARPADYMRTAVFAVNGARGLEERARRLSHFHQAILLWHVAKSSQIRHFHAHFERPAADVAMLTVRFAGSDADGWSWSFTAHNPLQYMSDRVGLIRKVTSASFVVCVSHFGRSQLMNLVRAELWDKLKVIRMGMDVHQFRPVPSRGAQGHRILTVARLVPLKGHAVLLHAMAHLRSDGFGIRAVLVGEGPERDALKRLAQDLGIARDVVFAGAVGQDHIKEHYAAADAFCLPSFTEGVPVVLMEAMAMCVPVVATQIGGIPELVENGISGRLVVPGSPEHLAEGLRTILMEPAERRAEMGAAGRARIERAFRADVGAVSLLALFRSVPGALTAPDAVLEARG